MYASMLERYTQYGNYEDEELIRLALGGHYVEADAVRLVAGDRYDDMVVELAQRLAPRLDQVEDNEDLGERLGEHAIDQDNDTFDETFAALKVLQDYGITDAETLTKILAATASLADVTIGKPKRSRSK